MLMIYPQLKSMCFAPVVDLITTKEDKKFALAGHMASAIIEAIQKKGQCLPQDLSANDFTSDQIAQNWHLASALASVEISLSRKIEITNKHTETQQITRLIFENTKKFRS